MPPTTLLRIARRARVGAAIGALFAAGSPEEARTQERDRTEPDSAALDTASHRGQPLGTIIVQGARTYTTVGGASALVTSLDSLRLPPSAVLGDALRQLPFVLVHQNSRGEIELSIRGSDSRQAAVLLDGVPLTLGWDGRTDPSLIPLAGTRNIVLVRGLSSLLQGPNVLGGVLEMESVRNTSELDARPSLEMSSGVDHVGSHAVQISASAPRPFAGGLLTFRGGAGYNNRRGIPLGANTTDPGRNDLRTNSDAIQRNGFASLRYGTDQGSWIGLAASGYRTERGVPPELHVAEPRLWRYPNQSRLLAIASAGTGRRTTPFGAGDAELIVGVNSGNTEIQSFETMDYNGVVSHEDDDDRTVTARLLADHTLGRGELRTAFTFANVAFHEVIDGTANDYQQRLWSAASELDYPVTGVLRASGGLALDGSDTPKAGDKPPLGALTAWGGRVGLSTVTFGGRSRIHASVSRRVRFASLRELYSGALGRFEPNPALRPERLVGAELGATTIFSRWQVQTVAFHHRLSDAIVRTGTDDGKFIRVNRDGVISTGLELLGGWTGDQLAVNADMLVQHLRVADPDVGGQRRPEHQPEFRAGVDVATPLVFGVRGLGTFKYTGAQYCVHPDLQRDVRLAGQPRVDVAFDREWHLRGGGVGSMALRTVRTIISIDNVADRTIYDQCGLPQSGRAIRLGVSLGWH